MRGLFHIDSEIFYKKLALDRDHARSIGQDHETPALHGLCQCQPKLTGDMVVACARLSQRLVLRSYGMITLWSHAGDHGQGLNRLGDFLGSEPKIAVTALLFHDDHFRVGKSGQMPAGRLGRHTGLPRQLTGRQRLSAHQGQKDVGSGRIAYESCNTCNGVSGSHVRHGSNLLVPIDPVRHEQFGIGRSIAA